MEPVPVDGMGAVPETSPQADHEAAARIELRMGLLLADATDEPLAVATSELVAWGIVHTPSGAFKVLHRLEDAGVIWSPGSLERRDKPDGTRLFLPGRRPDWPSPEGGWRVRPRIRDLDRVPGAVLERAAVPVEREDARPGFPSIQRAKRQSRPVWATQYLDPSPGPWAGCPHPGTEQTTSTLRALMMARRLPALRDGIARPDWDPAHHGALRALSPPARVLRRRRRRRTCIDCQRTTPMLPFRPRGAYPERMRSTDSHNVGQPVSVRLPVGVVDDLRAAARENFRSMSGEVRAALTAHLEREHAYRGSFAARTREVHGSGGTRGAVDR